MKNILTKIPGFIYSLIILCTLLMYLLTYILNNLDPANHTSKIIFSLTLFLTSLLTIPTSKILFLIAEEDITGDLRARFRGFFTENILFSIFLATVILLKTYNIFNFTTVLTLVILYILISYLYLKFRKPRRIKRI